MEKWRYSSTIFDRSTRWKRVMSFTPLSALTQMKEPPVPIRQEAEWVPEPVCGGMGGGEEKFRAPAKNQTTAIHSTVHCYTGQTTSVPHPCILHLELFCLCLYICTLLVASPFVETGLCCDCGPLGCDTVQFLVDDY
jgi:hypothetical protein